MTATAPEVVAALRVLVVDDEAPARARACATCSATSPGSSNVIVGMAATGVEALAIVSTPRRRTWCCRHPHCQVMDVRNSASATSPACSAAMPGASVFVTALRTSTRWRSLRAPPRWITCSPPVRSVPPRRSASARTPRCRPPEADVLSHAGDAPRVAATSVSPGVRAAFCWCRWPRCAIRVPSLRQPSCAHRDAAEYVDGSLLGADRAEFRAQFACCTAASGRAVAGRWRVWAGKAGGMDRRRPSRAGRSCCADLPGCRRQ